MNHQSFTLEEIVEISKNSANFKIFAVPYKPKSYRFWVLGFHSEYKSGNLLDKNFEVKKFNSLDLLLKYINLNFRIDMFTVVVDV